MSLNKGSLNKANHNQKLDIEYLYMDFIAGENITAKQIVRLSDEEDETVLIAATDAPRLILGVALNDALITEIVRVIVYGVAEVVAGEELFPGDVIGLGATAGRAYEGGAVASGPGSAHKHTESLTLSAPDSQIEGIIANVTVEDDFCADLTGGESTKAFSSIQASTPGDAASTTHLHTIGGTIDNEISHVHSVFPGKSIGKALEYATVGNPIKILVCLI